MYSLKFFRNAEKGLATPKLLWDRIEEVMSQEGISLGENIDLAQIMTHWTEQSGYPLITITRVPHNSRRMNIEIQQVGQQYSVKGL